MLDLRAFFFALISVTTDFPSNIEPRSPRGTPVAWKRICRVEWWWWEPLDTCVLLQLEDMHNACGSIQTSSAQLYRRVIWCLTRALFLEWDGVSNSWRPSFLSSTHVNTHSLRECACWHATGTTHKYNCNAYWVRARPCPINGLCWSYDELY